MKPGFSFTLGNPFLSLHDCPSLVCLAAMKHWSKSNWEEFITAYSPSLRDVEESRVRN